MTKNKYCSPKTKNRVAGCFTLKDLQEMANALDIPSNRSAKQLYDDIADIMKYDAPCSEDFCWMKSPKLVQFANKLEARFRPEIDQDGGRNTDYQLGTTGIDEVLNQYTGGDFKFLGTSANDWNYEIVPNYCVNDQLCKLNLKEYQQERILTLFNPEADPLGTGWNIAQSKMAIGSGGFFGPQHRRCRRSPLLLRLDS